jgi:anti-anti-sigma factor
MVTDTQGQMRLSITSSVDNAVDFVRIDGEVDLADTQALGLAARRLIDADTNAVYVDLAGTTFMGSTLVAFLVHIGNNDAGARRSLVLCRSSPMTLRVIHLTGLDKVATLRPDLPPLWQDDAGEPAPPPAG